MDNMDVLAELERHKCSVDEVVGNQAKICCPQPEHKDSNPSCIINLARDGDYEAGSFFCHGCKKGGNFYMLLGLMTGIPAAAFKRKYTAKSRPVAVKHLEVWNNGFAKSGRRTGRSSASLRELENRGVSLDTINNYYLGFDEDKGSIMIPIMWGSRYVNVRRYRPGKKPKFEHYSKGYGGLPTLYPQDQLSFDKIIVCGGEVKALAVLQRMNKHGYGAISQSQGEGAWHTDLTPWFIGKTVYVCYDVDSAGRDAAEKTCSLLNNKAAWVGNLKLPLDPIVYPTGDINDYFMEDERTAEDLLALIETTFEWEPVSVNEDYASDPEEVKLKELVGYDRPFNFKSVAYISGVDDSVAHKMPKEVTATCDNDYKLCSICKLQQRPGFDPVVGCTERIDGRNPVCIRLVGVDTQRRGSGLKYYFGIPEDCPKCDFGFSEELLTVRYALLNDTEADTDNPVQATIITDGEDLHYGDVCYIEGRADQSPLTTEETRVITKHIPRDILSGYHVSDVEQLEKFRPDDDSYQALDEKLNSIWHDLERNVTFIYDRKPVHALFDLSYHSPLWIPYANSLEPGWVSVLIVSETAQGKSTIMRRLMKHYGYGAYIDAANTTIAGLVGGVKTVGKRQFLKWGVLPQNDKRLVCIEEYANAQADLLRAMRAARDSGVVKLDKIDKGAAKARTRTVVLSNPKKLVHPNAVVDGLSLLEDLVERPEDLRRFDVGMWVTRMEIDQWHESTEPIYSTEACHELITWAWTIPHEKIRFTEKAANAIRHSKMSKEFPFLHLIGGREFEIKLARLSAAIAARTYSEEDNCLVIHERHVRWIESFLTELYHDPEFGYEGRIRNEARMDEDCQADQLTLILKELANPMPFIDFCLQYNRYRKDDLKAAVGSSFAFDSLYQRLLLLGCMIPEDETKWCNAFVPTKRFKKILPALKKHFHKTNSTPDYMM